MKNQGTKILLDCGIFQGIPYHKEFTIIKDPEFMGGVTHKPAEEMADQLDYVDSPPNWRIVVLDSFIVHGEKDKQEPLKKQLEERNIKDISILVMGERFKIN
ncbi:MAG: hypothetical protein QME25_00105 [Bacteroidota bacterium]|nr:hypothetical protein [Bacteroidota bacterium]